MKVEMFSIYDSKSKAFMQPFYAAAAGLAGRMFREACADRGTVFWKYPEDFTLFHIGSFDDATGQVEPLARHVNLGLASQFKGVTDGENAPE